MVDPSVSFSRLGYITIFGLLGVYSRYFAQLLFEKGFKVGSFWATVLINIIGSTLIGVIQVIGFERNHISENLCYGLISGFLGGFTTFSGFCLDSVKQLDQNQTKNTALAVLNLVLSPLLGFTFCYLTVFGLRKIVMNKVPIELPNL